ncbi:pyridoxal phosphate-dependent aminotransferase [Geomicrobium sp. JSM 1781026]|uniref:pyridoxal phosphate-dependent aminotransferase n=1 Tax=Geomicrobium sp. JSM 1781026 TaxID=3344580 RepID=UPI0035C02C04
MKAIDMRLGEVKIDTHENIKKFIAANALKKWPGYTMKGGSKALRELIVDWDSAVENTEEVLISDGATSALSLLISHFKDKKILIPNPSFIHYTKILNHNNCEYETYRILNSWEHTISDIKKGLDNNAQVIIWNSPNNPTGLLAPYEIEEELEKLCTQYGSYLIDDDVYREFISNSSQKREFRISLKGKYLKVYSFSKSFSLAGIRVGYVSGDKNIIKSLTNVQWDLKMSTSWLSQLAARGALTYAKNFPMELYSYCKQNINWAKTYLDKENIPYLMPQAGMFLCVDIKNTRLTSQNFVLRLSQEKNLLLTPGYVFGTESSSFIRLSAGVDKKEFEVAIVRLAEFYKEICNEME